MPFLTVALGLLAAVACAGLWPSPKPVTLPIVCLGVSLAAGSLLLPVGASTLPWYDLWIVPILSLAGGASVALSLTLTNE